MVDFIGLGDLFSVTGWKRTLRFLAAEPRRCYFPQWGIVVGMVAVVVMYQEQV